MTITQCRLSIIILTLFPHLVMCMHHNAVKNLNAEQKPTIMTLDIKNFNQRIHIMQTTNNSEQIYLDPKINRHQFRKLLLQASYKTPESAQELEKLLNDLEQQADYPSKLQEQL